MNDVYFGVDVWGRGSHGGGGFGSHKAISHIDPESLGLSVALFGQAWTWETEQDKPGFTWDTWWAYDRLLWLGAEKEGEIVQITEPTTEPVKGQEEECVHGTFTPIASFFTRKPPPNPSLLPFFTSFSPGVGFAWFVDGKRVFQAEHGWTDVDKCTSLGDLIWPNSSGPGACGDPGLKVVTSLSMEDAWLGGSSLRIVLSLPQTTNDTINTHWLPIQSLSITPRRTYNLSLTLKLASMSADFDIELSIREIVSEGTGSQIALSKRTVEGLPSNWSQHSLQFDVASESASDLHCAVGITIRSKNPSARDVTILLGALSAYLASTSTSILQQRISYVNFERETLATQPPPPFSGFLEWSNSAYMAPLPGISLESEEDPHPAWTTDPSYPSFLYYNIYFSDPAANQDPIFLGTSGFDGAEKRFHIDSSHPALPIRTEKDGELRSFRFHVQGITNHGDVLPWDQCSHTDVTL